MKNNNIIILQEMLMEEIKRVMELDINSGLTKREIERSKAISGNANNYLKAVNTNLKIKTYADATKSNLEEVSKELGIVNDEN